VFLNRRCPVPVESILPNFFFLRFFFFGVKLGHFTTNNFFLYVMKTQAYQGKTEKFFVSEEKKFGRIDSCFWKEAKKKLLKLNHFKLLVT